MLQDRTALCPPSSCRWVVGHHNTDAAKFGIFHRNSLFATHNFNVHAVRNRNSKAAASLSIKSSVHRITWKYIFILCSLSGAKIFILCCAQATKEIIKPIDINICFFGSCNKWCSVKAANDHLLDWISQYAEKQYAEAAAGASYLDEQQFGGYPYPWAWQHGHMNRMGQFWNHKCSHALKVLSFGLACPQQSSQLELHLHRIGMLSSA